MKKVTVAFAKNLLDSAKDLAPIILVIAFFQLVVLQQSIPDFGNIILGTGFVLLGLTLFIYGLNLGLFPIGEALAFAFVKKGSLVWLLIFAFALGFGTTVAEPALIAVTNEAANVAQLGGLIKNEADLQAYAQTLRYTVALSVGFSVLLGVLRIIKGWSLTYLIMGGYILVIITTFFAPETIIGIAYDSGGVTTSTITVPLVTALGVGLASSIRGRNPMIDGFGMIAIASLLPIVAVMIFGMLW
ncbi:MAG: Na(+), Li(+), K(+)/H(+) antiporter subunit A [Catillopecten margaritatus gill symbiont]|uniref:Na(+), Li(+), K(+)/H(+) antiporter subunit A n=1 Tax=Catillopecten margaritatus gill symbiont TaxID=3083288 RepID=A0AAU6PES5_9GAMM